MKKPPVRAACDHFGISGSNIIFTTNVGEYTVEYLKLNRASLRKLRELRRRIADCDQYASEGALWLKRFHIDRLPQRSRLRGNALIKEALDAGDWLKESTEVVRKLSRSDVLLEEDDAETRERKRRLKALRDRMLV